ncbi:P22 coat protein - protein 5 domain protein [Laceyella sacchari]|uniref:Major capsid protein, N4-gp56 family n=1 Tax=Laceyella tengchongensis TaxID=574699 RepID=A0AA46AG99_9BACL|nr:P22 phage major capsid protein family protein [Laceyella tengchongensis]AUS07420.1 P22 coat protein - protein 5 domain protein [Laceyella sacchari]SMP25145.1 major capsid protein, N4-gp56 family [Laceyella tengchongensis]
MAIDNFIPEIWSAQLLENLRKNLVYGNLVNTDYEGEIREYGDTVHIQNVGPISVFDYTKNTDMAGPETLSDGTRALVIDQAKAFNFQVDDVDRAQQNPKIMQKAMEEASYALADVKDRFIANLYTDAVSAIGNDTTPIVPTKDSAYDYLVDLSVVLSENDIPRTNRWVVVPEWYHGLLLKDDRFIRATALGGQILQNGFIGRAAGFDVYTSNNVPNASGAKYKIIAGHTSAITFASQLTKIEAYRPEKRFADAVKGLSLYGAKAVKPKALAVLTANKS